MYGRLTTVQLHPDKVDEATRIWREEVLPLAEQTEGFRGVLVFGDRSSGKGGAITLWETEAAMQASAASGYLQQALAKFAPVFAGHPTQENVEILLNEQR